MIEGATDSHYSGIAEVTDDDLWQAYMVVVTDRYKNESRSDATVHIHPELKITEQLPETLEAYDGDWEDLHVEAGGYNLRYRWQLSKDGGENWTNISGATGSYYHFRTRYDGYQYRCRVTDGLGHKICVVCGMTEPTTECKHDWSNNDGVCTICGERCTHNEASYCQEARFDYESDSYECKFIVQHNLYCSICNVNITEKCNDSDSDGKCDICGECMHTNLQKEQMDGYMHNIICIDCNKEISSCEPCHDMNGDSLCDICGNWIAGSAGPGMNECTCGCGLTGCTCGPECPICGNMSTSSANDNMQETTEKEFSEGADAETLFSDGQGMESLDMP